MSQLRVEMNPVVLLVRLLLKHISKQLLLEGLTMRGNKEFVLFENASFVFVGNSALKSQVSSRTATILMQNHKIHII